MRREKEKQSADREIKKQNFMIFKVLIENFFISQPPSRDAPPPAGITSAPVERRENVAKLNELFKIIHNIFYNSNQLPGAWHQLAITVGLFE